MKRLPLKYYIYILHLKQYMNIYIAEKNEWNHEDMNFLYVMSDEAMCKLWK